MSKKKKQKEAAAQNLENAIKMNLSASEPSLIKKPVLGDGPMSFSGQDESKVDLNQKINNPNDLKRRMDKSSFVDFKGKNKQILKGNTKH